MKIIACCIMVALQQCCFAQGGGGGFGGMVGAAAVGPEVTTTGTVFDPSGVSDTNAVLTVWRSSRSIATNHAAAGGKYSLEWEAPAQGNIARIISTLIVRDQKRNFVATLNLAETNTHLEIHLLEGLSLTGSVQDAGGKPVPGIEVRLNMTDNNIHRALDRTLTDAQGSFTFSGLPQEEEYSVFVNIPLPGLVTNSGPGFYSVSSSGAVKSDGYGSGRGTLATRDARTNHYAFPAFVLKKADQKVAGYVLDGGNKPVPGATLHLVGEGQPMLSAVRTDEQGHFAFDGVCDGPIKIVSTTIPPVGLARGAGGMRAAVTDLAGQDIRAGNTNLVLTLGDKQPDATAR